MCKMIKKHGWLLLPLMLGSCATQQVAWQDDIQRQNVLIEDMRTELADGRRQQQVVITELEILAERMGQQEKSVEIATKTTAKAVKEGLTLLEERIATLQQRQSQMVTDMKRLAGHTDEKGKAITEAREEIARLRRDLNQQVGNCKEALESVIAVVQQGSRTYRVCRGETLGEIAQAHGFSVDELKAANGLTSDMIFPDQELLLPKR